MKGPRGGGAHHLEEVSWFVAVAPHLRTGQRVRLHRKPCRKTRGREGVQLTLIFWTRYGICFSSSCIQIFWL